MGGRGSAETTGPVVAAPGCSPAPGAHGPLGIVACAGSLPIEVATHVVAAGRSVHVVAIEGFADASVTRFPHTWVNIGRMGALMAALRAAGCRDMVVAGALRRPDLRRIRFDLGTLRMLPALAAMTRGGDDHVLRRLVAFFEGQGFRVCGVQEVAQGLVATAGTMAGPPALPAVAVAAIERAGAVIGALGAFDIGQAVVATAERVLAIEAAEGTDGMLGGLARSRAASGLGPAVLVKLPKPGQELRVDLPAVGPRTIDLAAGAGLAGIAVAAGAALILERRETYARAAARGLFLVGVDAGPIEAAGLAAAREARAARGASGAAFAVRWRACGHTRPRRRDLLTDLGVAERLLATLRVIRAGRAAVVARERVMRIDSSGGLEELLDGLVVGRDWGLEVLRRRFGVLALEDCEPLLGYPASSEALAQRIHAAGLAGLAIMLAEDASQPARRRMSELAAALDARGLFLVTTAHPECVR